MKKINLLAGNTVEKGKGLNRRYSLTNRQMQQSFGTVGILIHHLNITVVLGR